MLGGGAPLFLSKREVDFTKWIVRSSEHFIFCKLEFTKSL